MCHVVAYYYTSVCVCVVYAIPNRYHRCWFKKKQLKSTDQENKNFWLKKIEPMFWFFTPFDSVGLLSKYQSVCVVYSTKLTMCVLVLCIRIKVWNAHTWKLVILPRWPSSPLPPPSYHCYQWWCLFVAKSKLWWITNKMDGSQFHHEWLLIAIEFEIITIECFVRFCTHLSLYLSCERDDVHHHRATHNLINLKSIFMASLVFSRLHGWIATCCI